MPVWLLQLFLRCCCFYHSTSVSRMRFQTLCRRMHFASWTTEIWSKQCAACFCCRSPRNFAISPRFRTPPVIDASTRRFISDFIQLLRDYELLSQFRHDDSFVPTSCKVFRWSSFDLRARCTTPSYLGEGSMITKCFFVTYTSSFLHACFRCSSIDFLNFSVFSFQAFTFLICSGARRPAYSSFSTMRSSNSFCVACDVVMHLHHVHVHVYSWLFCHERFVFSICSLFKAETVDLFIFWCADSNSYARFRQCSSCTCLTRTARSSRRRFIQCSEYADCNICSFISCSLISAWSNSSHPQFRAHEVALLAHDLSLAAKLL